MGEERRRMYSILSDLRLQRLLQHSDGEMRHKAPSSLVNAECAECCSCSFIILSCADNCVPASLQQLQND